MDISFRYSYIVTQELFFFRNSIWCTSGRKLEDLGIKSETEGSIVEQEMEKQWRTLESFYLSLQNQEDLMKFSFFEIYSMSSVVPLGSINLMK